MAIEIPGKLIFSLLNVVCSRKLKTALEWKFKRKKDSQPQSLEVEIGPVIYVKKYSIFKVCSPWDTDTSSPRQLSWLAMTIFREDALSV